MKKRTGIIAAIAAGIGLFALVADLYFGTAGPYIRSLHPTPPPQPIMLQANNTYTQNNRIFDEAVIPLVANQQYRLDDVVFTYLGNTTSAAGQCPPADLKSFNKLYHGNEIKHFSAILKNGTKVSMDTCWPLPLTPRPKPSIMSTATGPQKSVEDSIYFVHGVSAISRKTTESRWFDSPLNRTGIIQEDYLGTGKTFTSFYVVERTGQ